MCIGVVFGLVGGIVIGALAVMVVAVDPDKFTGGFDE